MIDRLYMTEALKEARRALDQGEIPVGAVVVHRRQLIARAHHQMHALRDPTAHAVMIAITQATHALGDQWLKSSALYVTAKPCRMCAGAMALAGVERVYYGVTGTVRLRAVRQTSRVLERECAALLTTYRQRRVQRKRLLLS